jgi:hypothetical protein
MLEGGLECTDEDLVEAGRVGLNIANQLAAIRGGWLVGWLVGFIFEPINTLKVRPITLFGTWARMTLTVVFTYTASLYALNPVGDPGLRVCQERMRQV